MRLNLFKYSIFLVGLLQAHVFFGGNLDHISASEEGLRVGPKFRELFRECLPSRHFNRMPRIKDYVLPTMSTFPEAQQVAMRHWWEDCTAYKVQKSGHMRLDEVEGAVALVLQSKNLESLRDSDRLEFEKISDYLSWLSERAYLIKPRISDITQQRMKKDEDFLHNQCMRNFDTTHNKASKMRNSTIRDKIKELGAMVQERAKLQRKFFEANRRNGKDAHPNDINCERKHAEAIQNLQCEMSAYEKALKDKEQRLSLEYQSSSNFYQ